MEFKVRDLLPNMTEVEYRKYPAVSYSLLSKLSNEDFSIFKDKEQNFSKGLSLGSVVDYMVFDKDFDVYKEYNVIDYIPNFNSDTAINKLLSYIKSEDLSFNKKDIENINILTKNLGLWSKILDDKKRIARIDILDFWTGVEYIKLERNNKPFILTEDLLLAFKMAETLKTHKNTKKFFKEEENIECIFQPKIIFNINGREVKSMLDVLRIDHFKKIIYPADLKTGADRSFFTNFNRFHYPLQASTYTLAVRALVKGIESLKDYSIAPFEFIYISRMEPTSPKVYDMHNIYINMGIDGWTSSAGIKTKGVVQLVDEYYWHVDNNVLDTSKEHYNRGRVNINAPLDIERARRILRAGVNQEIERVEITLNEANDNNLNDIEF